MARVPVQDGLGQTRTEGPMSCGRDDKYLYMEPAFIACALFDRRELASAGRSETDLRGGTWDGGVGREAALYRGLRTGITARHVHVMRAAY